MKEFRTEIKTGVSSSRIKLNSKIFTQGSCFAEAIGSRMGRNKLQVLENPFGVIYNPESIHKVLAFSIFNEPLPEHTYLYHQDVHANYNFHSQFSALRKPELESQLLNAIGTSHYFLHDTAWLVITYGTAWTYRRNDTGEIVANCHKQPAALFTKSLLKPEEIRSSFEAFYQSLKEFNPGIRIILTVSPVRHMKDSMELNSVSKAVLRVACHSIVHSFDAVDYFPAYEIMMDDLRDYRFYGPDMLHPTAEAEDYIWEKFMERYLDEETKDFIKKWTVILSVLNHRPFQPESPAHQQFLRDTLKKLEELKFQVNVEEEQSVLTQKLQPRP
jgi:hypothetical protein